MLFIFQYGSRMQCDICFITLIICAEDKQQRLVKQCIVPVYLK
jgi:hypothetical protein